MISAGVPQGSGLGVNYINDVHQGLTSDVKNNLQINHYSLLLTTLVPFDFALNNEVVKI